MRRIIVNLILAAAVTAFCLTGCGNGSSSASGSSKVDIDGSNVSEMEFVDENGDAGEDSGTGTTAEEATGKAGSDDADFSEGGSARDVDAGSGNAQSQDGQKIVNTVDPGADQVSAAQVPFGTKLTEQIATDDAGNWFSFVTGESGTYTITAVNLKSESEGDDINVRLYDTAGNDLGGVAAQHFGAPETIIAPDLEKDSLYFFEVTGKQGNGYVLYLTSPETDYDPAADLRAADPDTESVETAANTVEASLVPLNKTYVQSIGPSQNDWYAFQTKSEGSVYTVTVTPSSNERDSEDDDDSDSSRADEKNNRTTTENKNEKSGEFSVHLVDRLGNIMESQEVQTSQEAQSKQQVQDSQPVRGSQQADAGSVEDVVTALWNNLEPDTVYYIAVSGETGSGYTIEVKEGK